MREHNREMCPERRIFNKLRDHIRRRVFRVEKEHGQDQRSARRVLRIKFRRIWISAAIRVWYVNQVSFLLKPTPHIPQRYVVSLSKEREREAYRKRAIHLSLFLLYVPR